MGNFVANSIDWLVDLEKRQGNLGTVVGMLLVITTFITFISTFIYLNYSVFKFIMREFILICWGVDAF